MNVRWRERKGETTPENTWLCATTCVRMQARESVCAFMRGIRSAFIQDKCLSLPLLHLVLSLSSFSKEINQVSGVAIRYHVGNTGSTLIFNCLDQ